MRVIATVVVRQNPDGTDRKSLTKEQVLAYGIPNYNEKCRSIVMRCAGQWREVVSRMGRWIDFDNDYKTMDAPFMESVWCAAAPARAPIQPTLPLAGGDSAGRMGR